MVQALLNCFQASGAQIANSNKPCWARRRRSICPCGHFAAVLISLLFLAGV